MSALWWVLFWLALLFLMPVMFLQLPSLFHDLLVLTLIIINDTFFADFKIPNVVFWILFVYFFLTIRPSSISFALWIVLVLRKLQSIEFHWDATTKIILGWTFIIILPPLLYARVGYMPIQAFIGYAIAGILMRHTLYGYNEDFNLVWFAAWLQFLATLQATLPPHMPRGWYLFWMPFILLLGLAGRPDQAAIRFILWNVLLYALRTIGFSIFLYYSYKEFLYLAFPFNLFSHEWKVSDEKWHALNERSLDSQNQSRLCERCHKLTKSSKLIMGTNMNYLTRLVEWHRLDIKALDLRNAVTPLAAVDAARNPDNNNPPPTTDLPITTSCHLCTILWFSLSAEKRQMLEALTDPTIRHIMPIIAENATEPLRVKIWQERPLTSFTCAQLCWGELPIGARILIHRGKRFAEPYISVKSARTGTFEQIKQAGNWLRDCRQYHNPCNSKARRGLPTRLLRVQKRENAEDLPLDVKLVESTNLHEDENSRVEYLAFSHCWGPPEEFKHRTTLENIRANYEGINFHALSKNMQDALTITEQLGFSYVWVDCLCIIQDDLEDWRQEAQNMAAIYTNAVCTIASTGSASSAGGCFHDRNSLALMPCRIGVSSLTALNPEWIYARCDDVFDFERSVDRAPLNLRGWVLQERLMSGRILHFGANMIYWECSLRAASELNPHGYTYKQWLHDFENGSVPIRMRSVLARLEELEPGERYRRGMSWASRASRERAMSWAVREMLKQRPPPAELDPDQPPQNQTIWQRPRRFWKDKLIVSTAPWQEDDRNRDVFKCSGLRAAFEQLRGGAKDYPRVGPGSSTQLWYEIVESYSRCSLTESSDKLMAFAGVVSEVQRATNWTFMFGLWKENLLLNLLWFAAEKPGGRLRAVKISWGHGNLELLAPPTWSWVSIDCAVAVDLLPENSDKKIHHKFLVEVINGNARLSKPEYAITLKGPVLRIEHPDANKATGIWNLRTSKRGAVIARFFPDIEGEGVGAIHEGDELACLSFLMLEREKSGAVKSSKEDIQGLVIRKRRDPSGRSEAMARDEESGVGNGEVEVGEGSIGGHAVWERVGYFTTSYIPSSIGSRRGRRALQAADIVVLVLSGEGP